MSKETQIQQPPDINPAATISFEIPHPLEQIDLIASTMSVVGQHLSSWRNAHGIISRGQ